MTDYDFPINEEDLDREWEELTKFMSEEERNNYLNYYISAMNDEDLGEGKLEINLKKELDKVNNRVMLTEIETNFKNKESGFYN